jgi:sporulation protein YlmC with PRC-barrel domain
VKPDGPLKLLAELRDLQIVDIDGRACGVCDDVELSGGPGRPLKIAALLVGPGAWRGRIPAWAFWFVRRTVGEGVVRVPWRAVDHITSRIFLGVAGEAVGLRRVEDRLQAAFQRIPFP